jgi:hypothetical protein
MADGTYKVELSRYYYPSNDPRRHGLVILPDWLILYIIYGLLASGSHVFNVLTDITYDPISHSSFFAMLE